MVNKNSIWNFIFGNNSVVESKAFVYNNIILFKIISEELLITLMSLFMLCNLWSSKHTAFITYSIFIQQDNYLHFSDEEKEVQRGCDLTNHGVDIWMCLLISNLVFNCPYWAPSRWYHILRFGDIKVDNTN